ncbi:TetR/AcrR family transcriptional regulator [Variovorax sp.]|jgi:AcrR family transcriptional regulator|uniref:TetR/AcrR family transcriptional regulator n=1 Tax=Variovorax sp. TaxID=1871043 RepID=UPI0037DA3E8D
MRKEKPGSLPPAEEAAQTESVMGRPRSPEVSEGIMRTALELLAEKGFSGLTVNEICARSGVSRASFYRRWVSPADAVAEAVNQAFHISTDLSAKNSVDYLLKFALALEHAYAQPLVAPAVGFLIAEIKARPDAFEHTQEAVRARREAVGKALEAMPDPPRWNDGVDLDLVLVILSGLASNAAVTGKPLSRRAVKAVITRLVEA